jgi:hypothetical protein
MEKGTMVREYQSRRIFPWGERRFSGSSISGGCERNDGCHIFLFEAPVVQEKQTRGGDYSERGMKDRRDIDMKSARKQSAPHNI